MKKLLILMALLMSGFILISCQSGEDDIPEDNNDVYQNGTRVDGCEGSGEFVFIDGVCYNISDFVSDFVTYNEDGSVTINGTNYEVLDDFIADLDDSVGLAVVSEDQFNQAQIQASVNPRSIMGLKSIQETDDTENIIVKLTESGIFEVVDFRNENGDLVDITSNPLALEAYGPFTIVIFEVNDPNQNYGEYQPTFIERIYTSVQSGGVYLIHNETGKLFQTKDIEVIEHTYTDTQDYSRYVDLEVTLGEPIVEYYQEHQQDEFGQYIYDEYGQPIFIEVQKTVVDENGDPIIYDEGDGPVQTVVEEVQLFEYWEVPVDVEGEYQGFNLDDLKTNGFVLPEDEPELNALDQVHLDHLESLAQTFNDNNDYLNMDDEALKKVIDDFISQVMQYFDEQQIDINMKGETEIVEVPILDKDGNPVFETRETVATDALGNVLYQETFIVNFYIEDIRENTYIDYEVHIEDNPLSEIAQKFVDQVITNYYDWSYYRVNNNNITSWGFGIDQDALYYIDYDYDDINGSSEMMVKKMSFDIETNELLLEDYLPVTKAGLDNSELILDPLNNMIIARSYDGNDNLKIYSATEGLVTVTDSEYLMPVTFPNGELYFYNNNTEYVEELGYYTTMLYTITPTGQLIEHYIELGETFQVCYGDCQNGFNVTMVDDLGEPLYDEYNNHWINFDMDDGDVYIESADLVLVSTETFDSTRTACEGDYCYYDVTYRILDSEGNLIQSFMRGFSESEVTEVPPYEITYQLTSATAVEYLYESTETIKVCDNSEFGCMNSFNIHDPNVGQEGLWMWTNIPITEGEQFIQDIEINESSDAVYEYTRTVSGFVCEIDTCEEQILTEIYNLEGELVYTTYQMLTYSLGETVPIRIEYHMTDETTLVENGTCNSSSGCYEWYMDDDFSFGINYDLGDVKYASIEFAETDKIVIESEVQEAPTCLDPYGCWNDYDTEYVFVDQLGEVLFTVTQNISPQYGYRIPYKVTVELDVDATVTYQKEYSQDIEVSDADGTTYNVEIVIEDGYDYIYLGTVKMTFDLGEQIIRQYKLDPSTDFLSESYERTCQQTGGCDIYTQDYTVIDADGNPVTLQTEYMNHLPVHFNYGDLLPHDDKVTAVFQLSNVVYRTQHVDPYQFMYQMQNMIILDENLYLIENNAYQDQSENLILSYDNETGHYYIAYTNLSALTEITPFNDGFVAINDDQTAIYQFTFNAALSSKDYFYFDEVNLTEGEKINAARELTVDYDGTVYFVGVDNFINDITGIINVDGTVLIDTEVVDREVVRVTPIN